jgi:hypothetical protein
MYNSIFVKSFYKLKGRKSKEVNYGQETFSLAGFSGGFDGDRASVWGCRRPGAGF